VPSYELFYSYASIDKRKEKKRNINIDLAILPSHNIIYVESHCQTCHDLAK